MSHSFQVGTLAVAEISYIGGFEGPTEYWWMRISPEGKRTQVTEPKPIPYTNTNTHASNCSTSSNTQATAVAVESSSPSPSPAPAEVVDGSPTVEGVDREVSSSSSGEAAAVMTEDIAVSVPVPAAIELNQGTTITTETAVEDVESWAALVADPRYYLLTEGMLLCSNRVPTTLFHQSIRHNLPCSLRLFRTFFPLQRTSGAA